MKVHFAGYVSHCESIDRAGINYVLETFYVLKTMSPDRQVEAVRKLNLKKHSIIDSGLFTLMFGAQAGTPITEQFIIDWQTQYAEMVNRTKFKHTIVECDVQKKLSPGFAWEMRKRFKTQVKNQIMNVYHLEDENPDELIRFSNYIAVSIPELRIFCSKKERYKITEYISSRAIRAGKKVHLLGCTEKQMMRQFSYCTSSDSTSWNAGDRFGRVPKFSDTEITTNMLHRNRLDGFSSNSRSVGYYLATASLKTYEKYAGSQL